MKKMKKCKFCNTKLNKKKNSYNFKESKSKGVFYHCTRCKIFINFKISKEKIYTKNIKNLNVSNKNFLYYLKSIFLLLFYLRIKPFFPVKKNIILDFGSGSGELTNLLVFFNNKTFATDFEFNRYNYSKKIKFIKSKNLFNKNNNNKFDMIIMRHVLEHILDFERLINKLKKLLKKKSGTIVIEVPNYDSIWNKILRGNWPGYFYPYHHYVFSEKFLKKQLIKNGLKLIKINKAEPPIFGAFFYSIGLSRNLSRLLSVICYPIQILVSKITFKSEALILFVKND